MSESFRINTNVGALKAYSALAQLNNDASKAQLRIASQKRINNVADDTSGFNVGKSLDSKVRIMESAQRNVGSAQDMLATAESQLISVKDMLTGIRAKIADASNPVSDNDSIAKDLQAVADELASAFSSTKFNDTNLLQSVAGGAGAGFTFQTGVETDDTININYGNVSGSELVGTVSTGTGSFSTAVVGLSTEVAADLNALKDVTADTIASLDIDDLEDAVDASLGSIGNYSQRLDSKQEFLTSAISNSKSAYSRLFDADMAMEQLNATKAQIGSQAATSMFSQLNFAPQGVLQLLG